MREFRRAKGLSQKELGRLIGTAHTNISKIEKGDRSLKEPWLSRAAEVLDRAPADLINGGALGLTIPIVHTIRLAEAEADGEFDLPRPQERISAPPGLADADRCFAAYVADDSANRLQPRNYPRGSTLTARRIVAPARLEIGQKVIVRRFITTRADGRTFEILAGRLDREADGTLIVQVRSSNPRVPASVIVQEPPRGDELADRVGAPLAWTRNDMAQEIEYRPAPDDPAELLGVIVYATTRE